MIQFSAPWGRFLKWVSIGITVLICGAFWVAAPFTIVDDSAGFQGFLILLPIVLLGSSAIFIIRWYEITADSVDVVRVINRVSYPISEIESAVYEPNATRLSIRVMGNGGLYSFSGYFRNKHLGAYRAFVTDKANTVVIYRDGLKPVVVSPDRPNEFVAEIERRQTEVKEGL